MQSWKLIETPDGLRMQAAALRTMETDVFTWAHLLYGKLGRLEIGVFYFPSRFDTDTDNTVIAALHSFGSNTGSTTLVGIWDTKDPEMQQALKLFGLNSVPAVVLITGLQVAGMRPKGPGATPLYSITFSDVATLSDVASLQRAINSAHEVLARCNPQEIADYIDAQAPSPLLTAIGKIAGAIRDEILKFKPKFGLPGGASIQLG